MSRRDLHLAFLLSMMALVPPTASRAGTTLPDPANSTVPRCITLVGTNGGVPASSGAFQVVIRDLANNPVPGATVTVDLSLVTDVSLCNDQLDPNVVLDCANRRVTAITDLAGRAFFTLVGGGNPGGARTFMNSGRVYWDGFLIATPSVNTYDADGSVGVGANDFAVWFGDFTTGEPYERSDYDCTGDIGANDLSIWLGVFGSGTQTASCTVTCP